MHRVVLTDETHVLSKACGCVNISQWVLMKCGASFHAGRMGWGCLFYWFTKKGLALQIEAFSPAQPWKLSIMLMINNIIQVRSQEELIEALSRQLKEEKQAKVLTEQEFQQYRKHSQVNI